MADGCLSLEKRIRKSGKIVFYKFVSINVNIRDLDHLNNLKSFLKSEHKVTVLTYATSFGITTQARFAVISPRIWDALQRFGLTQRKSLTCRASSVVKDDPNFWRGIVDGDGSIGVLCKRAKRYPYVQLDGNVALIGQFQNFVQNVTGNLYKICKHRTVKNFGRVHLSSQPAAKLLRVLYDGAAIALKRKQMAALRCLQLGGQIGDQIKRIH